MRLPPLLRKEIAWGRRKLLVLGLLFVVVPAVLGHATLTYENVLPTNTPVAVVARSAAVTPDDLAMTEAAITFFSDPVTYGSRAAAFQALEREQVYAIVTVPQQAATGSDTATFRLFVDGSVVPYHQPSRAIVSAMGTELRDALPASIDVDYRLVGHGYSLSQYLVPTFELVVALFVALVYLPYTLANERGVFERLRVESSLAKVVAWRLAFFTALVSVPLLVFAAVAAHFGYGLDLLHPGAVAAYLLAFVTLAALSMAVTLATRFATWGRLVNLLAFLGLLLFSGLFYPAGFFSAFRRSVVRALPTHYAMVTVRGYAMRGAPLGTYADWLAGLAAVAVAALVLLYLSVVRYERLQ